MGVEAIQGLARHALGPDGGAGRLELGDLVLQPLPELGRQAPQGRFGLGDGVRIDPAQARPHPITQVAGGLDNLSRGPRGDFRAGSLVRWIGHLHRSDCDLVLRSMAFQP